MSYHRGIVAVLGTGANLGKARVQFPQRDNMQSHWIPFVALSSQGSKDWASPQVGAQVACLMDEHFEDGCILGQPWGTTDAPPGGAAATNRITSYADGTVVTYDLAAHSLTVALGAGGSATITQPNGAAITMPANGQITLQDPSGTVLEFTNNGTLALTGNLAVTGEITDLNDVHGAVETLRAAYNAHHHTGTQPGSGSTGLTDDPVP